MIRILFAATALIACAVPAQAQNTPGEALEALYDVISGPVGEARDWDRFRSLFIEGARMTIAAPGEARVATLSVEDYIARNGEALSRIGFTETETGRRTYVYGEMATILSAYEAVRADTGETVATGVNSLVIMETAEGWKIASLAWRPADAAWPPEAGLIPID
ncbi:MAG: hypothetical protein ACFE0P_11670 [Oceanicaulis sp.]